MKNKAPLIGIPTNLTTVEEGLFAGMERVYVPRDYIKGILRAGGVPILLPIVDEKAIIEAQVEAVDAILLAGGQDVHPHYYNEEPSPFLDAVCGERDLHEIEVVKIAHSQKKPILGICRGLQLINIAFGGSLYQDIPSQFPTDHFQHSQKARRDTASHYVDIVPESKLFKLIGQKSLLTNSFHHQSIKKLAPGFKATAFAKDGVIEGIEKEGSEFVMAVQWHPEMMLDSHPEMQKFFDLLVKEAAQDLGSLMRNL